jgi:hypothetical protein
VIVAAVRQVADWLADLTTGVNALLASVPKDVGDPAPPNVTIYDETRDAWVAVGVVNRAAGNAGPLLLIRGGDGQELPLFPTQGDGGYVPCEVLIAYVRRAIVNQATPVPTDDAVRDALQTMRAVARSLALQYTAQQANPRRTQVDLDRPSIRLDRSQEKLGESELILMSLSVTLPALDSWSMGVTS